MNHPVLLPLVDVSGDIVPRQDYGTRQAGIVDLKIGVTVTWD